MKFKELAMGTFFTNDNIPCIKIECIVIIGHGDCIVYNTVNLLTGEVLHMDKSLQIQPIGFIKPIEHQNTTEED